MHALVSQRFLRMMLRTPVASATAAAMRPSLQNEASLAAADEQLEDDDLLSCSLSSSSGNDDKIEDGKYRTGAEMGRGTHWSITSSSVLSREAVSSKAEAAAANESTIP